METTPFSSPMSIRDVATFLDTEASLYRRMAAVCNSESESLAAEFAKRANKLEYASNLILALQRSIGIGDDTVLG